MSNITYTHRATLTGMQLGKHTHAGRHAHVNVRMHARMHTHTHTHTHRFRQRWTETIPLKQNNW